MGAVRQRRWALGAKTTVVVIHGRCSGGALCGDGARCGGGALVAVHLVVVRRMLVVNLRCAEMLLPRGCSSYAPVMRCAPVVTGALGACGGAPSAPSKREKTMEVM